jgi:hypothetical protein
MQTVESQPTFLTNIASIFKVEEGEQDNNRNR